MILMHIFLYYGNHRSLEAVESIKFGTSVIEAGANLLPLRTRHVLKMSICVWMVAFSAGRTSHSGCLLGS